MAGYTYFGQNEWLLSQSIILNVEICKLETRQNDFESSVHTVVDKTVEIEATVQTLTAEEMKNDATFNPLTKTIRIDVPENPDLRYYPAKGIAIDDRVIYDNEKYNVIKVDFKNHTGHTILYAQILG